MFLNKDIIDFINKIINSHEVKEHDLEKNIKEFRNYLNLTKMADTKTLASVDKIIECLPEIISLKKKIGYIDIKNILKENSRLDSTLDDKPKQRVLQNNNLNGQKHYGHYHTDSSSACGGSIRTVRRDC